MLTEMVNRKNSEGFQSLQNIENATNSQYESSYTLLGYFFKAVILIYLQYTLEYLIYTLNIAFSGNLADEVVLAGATTAHMILFIMCNPVIGGVNVSNLTLISTEIGLKNYKNCVSYLSKARVILFYCFLCQFLFFYCSEQILVYIGYDQDTSHQCSLFLKSASIGILMLGQYDCFRALFISLGCSKILLFVQIGGTIFHVSSCFMLQNFSNLGIVGIGLSFSFTYSIQFLIVHFYYQYNQKFLHLRKYSQSAFMFQNTFIYLKQISFSALMFCLEFWANEIITLESGYLTVLDNAVQGIMVNTEIMIGIFAFAISLSAQSLLAKSLQLNDYLTLKKLVRIIQFCSFFSSILCSIFIFTFRELLSGLFSNITEVQVYSQQTYMFLACYNLFDNQYIALCGVLRGLGMSKIALISQIICLYFVGVPFSYYFAFVCNYYVKGLWLGQGFGVLLLFLFYQSQILQIKWKKFGRERFSQDMLV